MVAGRVIPLAGLLAVLLAGCTTGRTASLGGPAPGSLQLAELDDAPPRLARSQAADPGGPPSRINEARPVTSLPEPPKNLLPGAAPILPVSATLGQQQVAALLDGSKLSVKVRAWVNGQPIFDDEVRQLVLPMLASVERLPEPQRSEKMAELYNNAIDHVIDQEVMCQDAVRKLEKNDPKSLAKLKLHVNGEYEKRLKRLRDAGMPEDALQAVTHILKRVVEREVISNIYASQRIKGSLTARVTLEEVQAYYESHKEEFKTIDRVEWQDIFIAVGPKHPTPADARRFAEELIAKCRTPEDFAKLLPYDEGDSKLRGGKGYGEKQGEIRPAEVEPYLFQSNDGQIGPVVELPTGVHIFRVTKRERPGFAPMNDHTQKIIRNKLENQIGERELKQLVRELRERSVYSVVRE
jgi:hypothetical protein